MPAWRGTPPLLQPYGGLSHPLLQGNWQANHNPYEVPPPLLQEVTPVPPQLHHRVTASGLKCCKTRGCGSIKPYHACLPCLMQCASFKRFRHYEPSHDYLLVLLRCTSISVKRACEIWSHQSLIWQIGKPAAKHEAAMSQDLWFNAIVLQRMRYCFLFSF